MNRIRRIRLRSDAPFPGQDGIDCDKIVAVPTSDRPDLDPPGTGHPDVFIGCGCLIHDGQGRYLLVRETKAVARGRLALPAGKLEHGESIPDGAIRETLEETGLHVTLDSLLGVFHSPRTSEGSFGVNFVFAASMIGGTLTTTDEHPEHRWMTRDEIIRLGAEGGLRGPHAVEAVQRFEAGTTLPSDLITVVAASPELR